MYASNDQRRKAILDCVQRSQPRLFSERGVSGVKMSLEQKEKVIKDLIAFIERVSEGKTTSDTETLVLPDVVKALVNLSSLG